MTTSKYLVQPDGPKQMSKPVVFIAYPFNARDEWVKHCVIPLLRFYGCEPITGESLFAEEINIAVGNAITRSNLVIAFLTRDKRLARDKKSARAQWMSSEWVLQEIGFALGKGVPVVLIREEGFIAISVADWQGIYKSSLSIQSMRHSGPYRRFVLPSGGSCFRVRQMIGSRSVTWRNKATAKYSGISGFGLMAAKRV